jgi:hypothetical protein
MSLRIIPIGIVLIINAPLLAGEPPCAPPCELSSSIDLEWRPAEVVVPTNGVVEVGLYAIANGKNAPAIAGIQAIITWDAAALSPLMLQNNSTYDWLLSDLLNDSALDDLNAGIQVPPAGIPTNDGNMYYEAHAQLPPPAGLGPVDVPEDGLLVATFLFTASNEPLETQLNIAPQIGAFTCTAAFPGEGSPACDVSGTLGSATISIEAINPIVSSFPPHGAIDARQPSLPDGSDPVGWDIVELTFAAPAAGMTAADLEVTSTCGPGPSISETTINESVVEIFLSEPIPPGSWTTIRHIHSDTEIVIGALPGDVNADGTSSPLDILAAIDALNDATSPPIWSLDVNRSGIAEPGDILRIIDLLNGADGFSPWNQVSLCE